MDKPPVRLYALSTCAHCNALKRLLEKHKIRFEWTDVDLLPAEARDQFVGQIARYNPKKSFPIVIIGDITIIGDQRERIMKELGRIDGP